MDRGAARSRKRTQAGDKEAKRPSDSNPQLAKLLADKGGKNDGKGKGKGRPRDAGQKKEGGRPRVKPKPEEDRGPDQYKAKAIRTAHALVYSQSAFAIPPPPERLEGVTRVDLEGSGCTDVSWLPGSVTWLNLKGCPVTEGWDVVGGLDGLTGKQLARSHAYDSPQYQQRWPHCPPCAPVGAQGPQGARCHGERVGWTGRRRRRRMEGAQLSQCVCSFTPAILY